MWKYEVGYGAIHFLPHKSSFFDFPVVNAPVLSWEVDADLDEFALVGSERLGIAFVFYLLQGGMSVFVVFELKDVDRKAITKLRMNIGPPSLPVFI